MQAHMQYSFHAGEWAPALNARVDLAKYRSACALALNFFVDYRGGLSSRPGTKYVIQAWDSENEVRMIPFQASSSDGYMLEFGEFYVRFIFEGAPVLEPSFAITGVTRGVTTVIAIPGHDFVVGEVIYIASIVGTVELNSQYYMILGTAPNAVTIGTLNGEHIDSSAYGAWVSGGTAARVYYIDSPYEGDELAQLKWAQDVDQMILCHPNHSPYVLTLIDADNWTLVEAVFSTSVSPPNPVAVTPTFGAGNVSYAYVVTSVDSDGQESVASPVAYASNYEDMRTVAGTILLGWSPVGASSYNVYKAELSYAGNPPIGSAFGYIGNTTGQAFTDSNIEPDFTLSPPIANNPFSGSGVVSYTPVSFGSGYTSVPVISVDPPPAGGTRATANAVMAPAVTIGITSGGINYVVGDQITLFSSILLEVDTVAAGVITAVTLISYNATTGPLVPNPLPQLSTTGIGEDATFTIDWVVLELAAVSFGSGYLTPPTVNFIGGGGAGANFTAVLGELSDSNPSVPFFFQQRMGLAGLAGAPQTFHMSQPGASFNFDISFPLQADDAIESSLIAGQLNTIKAALPMPTGLILMTDRAAWLVNSGEGGAVSPINIVANAQSYIGISDVPPIVANADILFVQAKGSIVRNLAYKFEPNIYTGTDISVLSSHLFYGYTILEWAWAEEPFKLVWAVRDDGTMLTLTFLKEQELIGWCHSDTEGLFKSVGSVTEQSDFGVVDAVYTVVERVIDGFTVKYIERVAERIFPLEAASAWCVDAGLSYVGSPATTFRGARHLAGATCTGLADGTVIEPFTMPTDGTFTLDTAASVVVVGLAFTPQFQSLALDLGEPTVQGKRKKIAAVTVRVQETLGLEIGSTFANLVPMKDLQIGNVGSATNAVVENLVTGDARTIVDPNWTVPGQYCIQQPYPWPASILGVIPEIQLGDQNTR